MKCRRQKETLISILVIIFVASVKGKDHRLFKRKNYSSKNLLHKNVILPNTFQSWDSFPSEDYSDSKQHKIVKKQMGMTSEVNRILNCANKMILTNNHDYLSAIKQYEKEKFGDKKTDEAFNDCEISVVNTNLRRIKRLNDDQRKEIESNQENKITSDRGETYGRLNREKRDGSSFEGDQTKEKESLEGRTCNRPRRFSDENDDQYYYECQTESNGIMKLRRKRCPESERFSDEYSKCLERSFPKLARRVKRQDMGVFQKKKPQPNPEEDSEPSNEWLDATQGCETKIPSEFKPKPKLRLKIYHLRNKKAPDKAKPTKILRKRFASYRPLNNLDPLRISVHGPRDTRFERRVHRHHPRSFVIKLNKKGDQDETFQDESNMNDDYEEDDEEEYEEDDYEENEDEKEQREKKLKSSERDEENRLSHGEGLKDLFKNAKEAVVNKMKFNQHSSQFVDKLTPDVEKSEVVHRPEGSNKVLIDANIKVDREISNALRNILSQGRKKSFLKYKDY